MQTISTEQLQQMKQSGEEFALLNVLPQGLFEQAHIPGSENVPVDQGGFIEAVNQHVADKSEPIVVYCANEQCDASERAAKKLDDAGFGRVLDFAGGTASWREAGYEVAAGATA
jgi:rhodanese-related sulfurtransferase